MVSIWSGFVIWNAGSPAHPDFVPKEIYPPALQAAQLTETVYATAAEAQAAINAGGGPHSYGAGVAALGSKVPGTSQVIGAAGAGGWTIGLGNSTGLLTRALKVIIGAVLIIAGVIRFTKPSTTVLQLAKGAIA